MKYSKPPSQRQLRVGEEVRHILVDIFKRGKSGCELLDMHSLTVTEVRLSPDLRKGTVFVMSLGGRHLDKIIDELKNHGRYFTHEVARKLTTKTTPRLSFKADDSFEEAHKIESLLRNPKVAQDLKKTEGE